MRCGRVGDGAVVGFFVVAIGGEGVGDAGEVRFDEAIGDGVVESLGVLLVAWVRVWSGERRTGPVRTFLDFVVHVPTSSVGYWA